MTEAASENNATAPDAPAAQQAAETPPWGEDFNAEKAWNLIQNLRSDKEKLSAREILTDDAKAKLTEYEALVEASKSDAERQAEELQRWQASATTWRDQAVAAHVQALAAVDFADPSDAMSALDTSKYVDAGGQIDTDAIKADLAAVLEKKPHWRRPSGETTTQAPRVPLPNLAQGAGGNSSTAKPADEFAAILQAQMKGLGR